MAKKRLRTGFSTGTSAAAAAKAALMLLTGGKAPEAVEVRLPIGKTLSIPVHECGLIDSVSARASVIKDAGDDPDVTNKAEICALVQIGEGKPGLELMGGQGVGRVTLPGLEVPVGEPAINPVPREMIRQALLEVWNQSGLNKPFSLKVTISVPKGEELAPRTLNPRLGIVGGISILGTSGIVKPLSHEAYTATIKSALSVALAEGLKEVVLTTGGRSEKHAMALRPDLPDLAFIQIADYFGFALSEAAAQGVKRLGLVVFFGKAVKQAQGLECTHAHKSPLVVRKLAAWLGEDGAGPGLIENVHTANTARHALEMLRDGERLDLVAGVGARMMEQARRFGKYKLDVWGAILDYDGSLLFQQGLEI